MSLPVSMGDFLYNRFPKFYLEEDAKYGYPLKQFMSVMGIGLDAVKDLIEGSYSLFDVDACPDRFLPLLAASIGVDFPYDMPPDAQRRYIKIAPIIMRTKGTIPALEYLAREFTGQKFTAKVIENSKWDTTTQSIVSDRKSFILNLVANQDTQTVNATYNRLVVLSEMLTPAGLNMYTMVSYVMTDSYDHSRLSDSETITYFTQDPTDPLGGMTNNMQSTINGTFHTNGINQKVITY